MKQLVIYIASSWKNQHAVEMLTSLLRERGHQIRSFVENNHGEVQGHKAAEDGKPMALEEWIWSERGEKSFDYDTKWATESHLVIYIGPSGIDAWTEVGAAWSRGIQIYGLMAKGEQVGLMRRMVEWMQDHRELLKAVDIYSGRRKVVEKFT